MNRRSLLAGIAGLFAGAKVAKGMGLGPRQIVPEGMVADVAGNLFPAYRTFYRGLPVRMVEENEFLEGMAQTIADRFIAGDPHPFEGFVTKAHTAALEDMAIYGTGIVYYPGDLAKARQ
jgi:hypothetical protein